VTEEIRKPESREYYSAKLSPNDFKRLSAFIYDEMGIKMPEVKKIMIESRLQKRLQILNFSNFKDYLEFVFSKHGSGEIIHMMDVITTNKTDFFREPHHFEFLQQEVIPEFVKQFKSKILNIWSAGCSSGEEPYTLAMVLTDLVMKQQLADFSIYATDISTNVLQKAVIAIYHENKITSIPLIVKKKYFLKSKDPANKSVRICPEIRRKVVFERFNFMDDHFPMSTTFDIIFCRNVIIYFDRLTQEKVINKLCMKLRKGGYFFLGHSESITNMNVPLEHIKPTIFRKI